MDALRVLGADVRPVPAVPFDNPDNYNHQARKEGVRPGKLDLLFHISTHFL